jgi:hypothetical protein
LAAACVTRPSNAAAAAAAHVTLLVTNVRLENTSDLIRQFLAMLISLVRIFLMFSRTKPELRHSYLGLGASGWVFATPFQHARPQTTNGQRIDFLTYIN